MFDANGVPFASKALRRAQIWINNPDYGQPHLLQFMQMPTPSEPGADDGDVQHSALRGSGAAIVVAGAG